MFTWLRKLFSKNREIIINMKISGSVVLEDHRDGTISDRASVGVVAAHQPSVLPLEDEKDRDILPSPGLFSRAQQPAVSIGQDVDTKAADTETTENHL